MIKDHIKEVKIDTRHSEKKNTDYNVLIIKFDNGYVFETLVNQEKAFLINMNNK